MMTQKTNQDNSPSPRLTIGLPVYNGERYLRETLDSLLAQTWRDFEIIISDNCSTDTTPIIGREYQEKDIRVRYFRTTRNNGAVANFNSIVGQARGEFFKWAAHDDLCAPTYLERCIAVLDSDPSVVLCHSETELINSSSQPFEPNDSERIYFFDETGRIVYAGLDPESRKLASPKAHERFEAVVLQTEWVYEVFGVFRINALKKTGLMKSFYGGDKLLLAQIATMGRIAIIPEKLFLNRRHADQSVSSSTTIEGREAWINPHMKIAPYLSRLARMKGFFGAAFGGEMTLRERLGCLKVALSYYVRINRWRYMLEEITGIRRRRLAQEMAVPGPSV